MTVLNIFTAFVLLFWPIVFVTSPMMLGAPGAVNDKNTIISLIVVLYYPVYVFILYALFGWTFFGFSSVKILILSIVLVTICMFLFGYTGLVYNALRGIASSGYSVSNQAAYYNGKAILDSEPNSFTLLEGSMDDYARDALSVYYRGSVVENAQSDSFLNLEHRQRSSDYWADDQHVYYSGKSLDFAKPDGFKILENDAYSVYRNDQEGYVYHFGKHIVQADVNTFVILSSHISKDQQNVYYATDIILPDADANSFILLSEDEYYAVDRESVYDVLSNRSAVISKADPKTIKILQRGYLSDINTIFYRSGYERTTAVQGADVGSFEVTGYDEQTNSEAKDKFGYFWQGKRLTNK